MRVATKKLLNFRAPKSDLKPYFRPYKIGRKWYCLRPEGRLSRFTSQDVTGGPNHGKVTGPFIYSFPSEAACQLYINDCCMPTKKQWERERKLDRLPPVKATAKRIIRLVLEQAEYYNQLSTADMVDAFTEDVESQINKLLKRKPRR